MTTNAKTAAAIMSRAKFGVGREDLVISSLLGKLGARLIPNPDGVKPEAMGSGLLFLDFA